MSQSVIASKLSVPQRVREGDTVAVCAPSGPVPEQPLRAGLALLRERFRVVVSRGVLSQAGYLAGPDERRADELNRCLRDPDIRAIVCARGGYGAMRLVDQLDADALRRDPIPIVGFSDITSILLWAAARAGVRAIHGPMVAQLSALPPDDVAWLFRLLTDPAPPGALPVQLSPIGPASPSARGGQLWGGNLALLSHTVGTGDVPDLHGAILFFEDVGERPYRIDRYLTHLSRAGALRGVACALVGEMTRCAPPDTNGPAEPVTAPDVIAERLHHFGVPGLTGLPLAHGLRNLALPLGARCTVELATGRVVLRDGAVG